MHATLRLAASAGLLATLAGCYGAPVTDQPIVAGAPVAAPNATSATGAPVVAVGNQCYAGAYICNLLQPGPVGTGCSCPGLGGPSYGTVR
jgi:hypothetical protein